ncbi:DUF222 domain-containing protein [Tsukamurella ocularis]|uniref:HNH endonuclease signature motif containing protein n=1 Tax=Tsukamurella ocularis TaxID=1970234 RepID=UPI0039EEE2F2
MEALSRARALTGGQAIEFDERLGELLTADPLALVSVPALREAADHLVYEIDPVAAERRRRMAEEDRRVTFRPAEDGMAAAYALLTAHEGLELGVRVDEIAGTVCESDPRTVPQRRADGLMMLARGYATLGCWCAVPGCPWREARAVGDDTDDEGVRVVIRYRTLIQVVVNEKTLTDPGDADAGFLIGHGPVTAQHARDLAARGEAVLRPFGDELPDTAQPADPEPAGTEHAAAEHAAAEHAKAESSATESSATEWSVLDEGDADKSDADEDDAAPHDADVMPVPVPVGREPAAGPAPRQPRSAWFRATGIDLAHREPAGILLAARCCHADLAVIDGPEFVSDDAPQSKEAAPASGSEVHDPAPPCESEVQRTERDSNGEVGEPAIEVQGTALPAVDQNRATPAASAASAASITPAVSSAPSAVSPRALVIAQGSSGYRFSADLTRYLALLYPRCVFPLCTRPASRCQLDHAREYDHRDPTRGGATTARNGQPLCVPHHQLKTAGLWTDAHLPDGRILWIGPTGERIIVDPTRTILGLFPDLTRITWTTPAVTVQRKVPAPRGPTRLQKEHDRRERLRAAHLDALTRERDEREHASPVEHHLDTVLAGRDPAHHPPPDEPPPF